ncbi:MerR family transcriptional regulator [Flavobacterium amnicola]|uniref:MerR family transcriptional regulator n=1 Tax=Flavobacterium amnicola TaxID=2506422 RepID=A0A4Q1K1R0_9FLAO|nr:MerR family transcriptional regulator [Flavobacterium amnicola]RXR17699.1 MerR family transcriptional regulator [Flavobacterium amnicola]
MNNIKNVFSIKDLENLSGIKAHTIRIWEKRYSVFAPMRTDTNIRVYDLQSLQKLLNITLLHNHGYKISKISKMEDSQISKLVKDIVTEKNSKNHAINAFKMAMMNFDQNLFTTTYNELLSEKSFQKVFYEVFIPLMTEIGLLWQSETISPAHEHFISHLIRQKILLNTEKLQYQKETKTDKVFVLFLPMNEIHELGLMYLNFEFVSSGYKTIYLGESVPTESLKDVTKYFNNIIFVTYMTVEPDKDKINNYLNDIEKELLSETNSQLWITGRMTEFIDSKNQGKNIKVYQSINQIISEL